MLPFWMISCGHPRWLLKPLVPRMLSSPDPPSPQLPLNRSSLLFSYSSTLFVRNGHSQLPSNQALPHSFPFKGGWGVLFSSRIEAGIRLPAPLVALCLQRLPTIKFHNSFVLITMQNAPGVGGARGNRRACSASHTLGRVEQTKENSLCQSVLFHCC